MDKKSEIAIIESWRKNVGPWVRAIDEREIESRNLATNRAILEAVLRLLPRKVLDIGCGEGWLARELELHGVDVLGIDAIPEFIDAAVRKGKGRFRTLTYEELSPNSVGEKFDVLVCNFSLFGKDSVESVFLSAAQLINSNGAFVIQTLHPTNHAHGEEHIEDGWREGSWAGFSEGFKDPGPWYFRTKESWKRLFFKSGFTSIDVIEPMNPKTGVPASIIFVGKIDR